MKEFLLAFPSLAAAVLLSGCIEGENDPEIGNRDKNGKITFSDPYKPTYQGGGAEKADPYMTGGIEPSGPARTLDSTGRPPAAAKTAVPGYYVGVIPWDVSFCGSPDRVNIYMDDEDQNNNSYHTSFYAPTPGGLNDGNGANTRMIMCKVPGENFKRLKSVNYMVFNFGDGDCPNGGINYDQIVDNEASANNNSWSGCCGSNNPDWWSTGGAYGGYVRLRLCYYPMDPSQPETLKLPSWLNRNYGVFTEQSQDNAYIKSWGVVEQDDNDVQCCLPNHNKQTKLATSTTKVEYGDFPNILDFSSDDFPGRSTWTRWSYGKIK